MDAAAGAEGVADFADRIAGEVDVGVEVHAHVDG
jgi:hypothetical protein